MQKVVFHTNYVRGNTNFIEKVKAALNEGKAVRIDADCIGHTRAMMVHYEAAELFKELGAEIVEIDLIWGSYYAKKVD